VVKKVLADRSGREEGSVVGKGAGCTGYQSLAHAGGRERKEGKVNKRKNGISK